MQSHNCTGLGGGDRCLTEGSCQYKLCSVTLGLSQRFCGKDQLTGHCCDAEKKDAEIARLNYLIAGYHEAIEVLRESKDKEIAALIVQVHALEKFNAWLKLRVRRQEDLGEALRKVREKETHTLKQLHELHDQIPDDNLSYEMIMGSIEEIVDSIAPGTSQHVPSKDEPELVICPRPCGLATECHHSKPHQRWYTDCKASSDCPECIPYKKEPAKEPELVICLIRRGKEYCPGKWPWSCAECPEYLKKHCSQNASRGAVPK